MKKNINRVYLIALSLLLIFSSCSLGRKYQRPEFIVPSLFSASATTGSVNSAATALQAD